MKTINFDNLIDNFKDNIDWNNYNNIDDMANIEIAKILDLTFKSQSTASLLKVTKKFTKVSSKDKKKQGKLLLKAMNYLDKVACGQ